MKKFIFLLMLCTFTIVQANDTSDVSNVFLQENVKIYTFKDGLPSNEVIEIDLNIKGNPIVKTSNGVAVFDGKKWKKGNKSELLFESQTIDVQLPVPENQVLCWAQFGEKTAVGTNDGLYLYDTKTKTWNRALPADNKYSWALRNVKTVVYDSKGRLWFGADQGVGYKDNKNWRLFTGAEGLPFNKFTCAAPGENGIVWFGTEKGAIRCDGNRFAYRFSRRWLPNDFVNDIVVDSNGTAWIATNAGVSHIEPKPMTLDEKADYFTKQVEERHNRMGFIADCRLTEQFDVNSWTPKISDNDGLYTAMYGAAHAFNYAITKKTQAKKLAKRSFEACKWLVDITHEQGFPARVIIPIDWPEPVNKQYGKEYNKRHQLIDPFWKQILPRFPKNKNGKYRWKCDTSSDELAGHYFFYGMYYDSVAETEAEKQPVRQVVADITDHLIRNGFLLRDHDGKPTRWGNFSPEFFNSVFGWEQRGLNSMMMLSFLNVALHVTGDQKYADTAKMLRDKHKYHINSMQSKMYFPPDFVVPWDNNLCLMSMYGLMKYETDPELLLMYRLSLEHAWSHVCKQKNAFWDVIYGALVQHFQKFAETGVYASGKVFSEAGPYSEFTAKQLLKSNLQKKNVLETLRGIPMDLIGYEIDNTHRLDVIFDPTPGQNSKIGWHYDGYAVPIEERGHVRQDRDGFALYANEDNGFAEHEGTFFLLPYFMAAYHEIIK
jgi:hypothetical protein